MPASLPSEPCNSGHCCCPWLTGVPAHAPPQADSHQDASQFADLIGCFPSLTSAVTLPAAKTGCSRLQQRPRSTRCLPRTFQGVRPPTSSGVFERAVFPTERVQAGGALSNTRPAKLPTNGSQAISLRASTGQEGAASYEQESPCRWPCCCGCGRHEDLWAAQGMDWNPFFNFQSESQQVSNV